jgi:putative Holliday junction resolvase
MSGNRGIQAQKVEQFIAALRRYVNLPIHEEDERLSTFEADVKLAAAGRRADQRKAVIDSIAAGVILENFLERRKKGQV